MHKLGIMILVSISVPLLTSCVILDKWSHLSEPQLSNASLQKPPWAHPPCSPSFLCFRSAGSSSGKAAERTHWLSAPGRGIPSQEGLLDPAGQIALPYMAGKWPWGFPFPPLPLTIPAPLIYVLVSKPYLKARRAMRHWRWQKHRGDRQDEFEFKKIIKTCF